MFGYFQSLRGTCSCGNKTNMNQKFGGCFILSIPLQVLVKSQCFSIFGPTVFFRGAHWTLVPCTNRGVSWWQVESLTWTWPSIRNFWGSWGRWSTRYDMCNILIPGTPWELIFPLQFLNCSLENNSRTVICTPERFFFRSWTRSNAFRTPFKRFLNVFVYFWTSELSANGKKHSGVFFPTPPTPCRKVVVFSFGVDISTFRKDRVYVYRVF